MVGLLMRHALALPARPTMVMVLVVVVVVSIESQLPTGLCARWTGAAAVKKKPCSWLGWVAGRHFTSAQPTDLVPIDRRVLQE